MADENLSALEARLAELERVVLERDSAVATSDIQPAPFDHAEVSHTSPVKDEVGLWYFEARVGNEVVGRSRGFETRREAKAMRDGAEQTLAEHRAHLEG
jgi:hypothetical protein